MGAEFLVYLTIALVVSYLCGKWLLEQEPLQKSQLADLIRVLPGWTSSIGLLEHRSSGLSINTASGVAGIEVYYNGASWVPERWERALIWRAYSDFVDRENAESNPKIEQIHTVIRGLATQAKAERDIP